MTIFNSIDELTQELLANMDVQLDDCYFKNAACSIPEELMSLIQQLLIQNHTKSPEETIPDILSSLSKREQECLNYTIDGLSTKTIAGLMDLSPRTIEEYLTRIKRKFNVRTKIQLMVKILR